MADRRQPCSRLQCPAMCGRSSLPRRLNWPSAAAALARRVRLARLLEAHLDPIARGWQSLAEGGQAASLVPQAVGDGAGKAEQLGAGRRQVDRVVVAGGTGIAPADVGGRLPVVDRLQRQRLLLGFRRNFAGHLDAAAEHLAVADPEQAKLVFQAGDDAEGGALVVRLQVFHRDAHGERAEAAERAQHVDAVLQVDQAEQREGEALVGEQRHLQREGEDVRVGRRQQAVVAEAADLAVALEVLRVHRDLAAQAALGQGLAADAAAQCGAQEQAGQGGWGGQVEPGGGHWTSPRNRWLSA